MSFDQTCKTIVADAGVNIPEIDCKTVLDAMEAGEPMPIIIDIRPEVERIEEGLIPGALHIPTGILACAVDEICESDADLDRPVLCQCRSGKRSLTGTQILKQSGFRCALSLRGGIKEWQALGGPVEMPRG